MTGKMSPFKVSSSDTVQSFKEQLYEKLGVPIQDQRLVFRGKVLEDTRTLSDYQIRAGETIYSFEKTMKGDDL